LLLTLLAVALFGRAGWSQPPTPASLREEAKPAVKARVPGVLPGTGVLAFATIRGNVLDSEGAVMADRLVRLRDARYGRIVGTKNTDRAGLFEFRSVEPGIYVVELIGRDGVLTAASDLLTVSPGTSATAVVQMPFRVSKLSALLGDSVPHVASVLSAAAAAGVLATEVTGEDISPQ
jgi:hypothetical protein